MIAVNGSIRIPISKWNPASSIHLNDISNGSGLPSTSMRIAMEYRQTFHTDVFIDILSYRKYGHNEGDEPRFTQPLLYKAINNHPNPRDIYSKKLIEQNIQTKDEILQIQKDFDDILELKLS